MISVAHKARIRLIQFAKTLPFILCGIVCISYIESIYALITQSYVTFGDFYVLHKRFSWLIGDCFVYCWQIIFVEILLSFATETCIWNKLGIGYLCINILERDFFITIELYEEYIYAIVILNMAISGFLLYKGIKQIK